MWKSRWPSWAPRPNEPYGSCGRKAKLNHVLRRWSQFVPNMTTRHPRTWSSTSSSSNYSHRVQELWKSRWPSWAPRPNELCWFFSVDVKQNWIGIMLTHWSQFVPNTSTPHPRTLSATSSSSNYSHRVQELCESRGGHPGLSVLISLMVSVDVKQHWTMLLSALVTVSP